LKQLIHALPLEIFGLVYLSEAGRLLLLIFLKGWSDDLSYVSPNTRMEPAPILVID
jgi:hypothetical protein